MKTDRERSKGVYDWNTRCTNRTLYIRRTYKTLLICLLHHCKTDDNKSIERKFQTQMPQLDLSHMKSKKAICCLCIAEIVLRTFAFVVIFSLSLCVWVFGVRFGTFSSSLNRFFFFTLFVHFIALDRFIWTYVTLTHTYLHRGIHAHNKSISPFCA